MNRISVSILSIICLAASANASSPYRPVIASVVDRNAELASQSAAISAEETNARAENTLEGPEIEFEHLWASASSDIKWNAGITQEFSFPGLYRARTRAAEARTEASRLALLGMKADKALSAKQFILDIINANARLEFYQEVASNMARISAMTKRSYEIGEATILDLRKMQLAETDNDRTIAEIKADITNLVAQLRGLGAEVPDSTNLWNEYPVQACQPSGPETDHLLYAINEAESKAGNAQAKATKLGAWPTFAVGYRHAYEERQHFNGLSVSMRLPSFSQKKKRQAAALEAESLSFATQSKLIAETSENNGLYKAACQLSDIMERYHSLSSDNSYLQLLGKAYDGGELNIIDYLNEINLFASARLSYLDLQYRYNLTLARLNRYRSLDF